MLADWEVEPGKIVEAYTYNGTVPAPEIHVEVGDRVQILLKNELPTPTTIHWHGIRVPNAMDGVPPFTQAAVEPGEEFLYEFEILEPAVGIYHSHNGASQVLDGLFGAFTVGQMQTPDVLLDQGFKAVPDQEHQMVLNDAGVIGLSLNGKSFPATEVYSGTVGETVMVHYQNEGLHLRSVGRFSNNQASVIVEAHGGAQHLDRLESLDRRLEMSRHESPNRHEYLA